MKNQIVASIAAIPFAVGAVFAGTGAANAAALQGKFQIGPGQSIPGDVSNIFLTENSLYFEPTPTPVIIDADTDGGTFSQFDSAYISQIITFDPFQAANPFLDFGNLEFNGDPSPGTIIGNADDSSLKDGKNIFNLTQSSYKLEENGSNVDVLVELWGEFVSETGEITAGSGDLTFQIVGANKSQVEADLAAGKTIGDMTFSGGLMSTASTPEPTTLFGLGVVATGLVASRRKKNS